MTSSRPMRINRDIACFLTRFTPSQGLKYCLLMFIFLTASLMATWAQGPAAMLHKAAPVFTRTTVDNKRFDLSALRGRVVLLNFWATWCGPCQVEIPTFVHWQQKYAARGLTVVGISMDDDPAPVRKLASKLHIAYPVLMGDEKIGSEYGGILGLPVSFVIDRSGQISAVFKGETPLPRIERALQSQLAAH